MCGGRQPRPFSQLTYLFVNLAVMRLNRERLFASIGGFILYAVIPALGIAADAYIVVQSFFIEQWHQGWATGKSVVVFDVICALLAALLALTARRPETTLAPAAIAEHE